MSVSLCIHGHFYQPPREDPWLGTVLAESSAAPMSNWNERITRESYAPLAWARRLDHDGRITDILNCYEWMSFNAGPTLLRWMRHAYPEVLQRMREGDANSLARWGHGNALAQIYHHIIMPLADEKDRDLEVRWAIDDFRHHFGRDPEGMWLSECAVDLPTLESVAAQGVSFVILAPRQAKAVVSNGNSTPVTEQNFNVGEPYIVELPSGARITAMFYHGRLSQGIAFEGLLRNGESFWQRIAQEAGGLAAHAENPLLTIATDGETYGHHFTFGEMALAHVLAQGYAMRDNIRLTNIAAYIASNPPTRSVILHEPSSWSCVHGIERWRSNCGCTDGGHPGWNQNWRGPLRDALNVMRSGVRNFYDSTARDCMTDPQGALTDYGRTLADEGQSAAFAAKWFKADTSLHDKAWRLLAMQEQALAAFASCAWFFDDIARIEPENAMTFALRAMELMQLCGGPDIEEAFMEPLTRCHSNQTDSGSGKDVYIKEVRSRRDDPATLCLLAWLMASSENGVRPAVGESVSYSWPEVSIEMTRTPNAPDGSLAGIAILRNRNETFGRRFEWRLNPHNSKRLPGKNFTPLAECAIRVWPDGGSNQSAMTCKTIEMSRPLIDYLETSVLEYWERCNRPEMMAVAAHAASLVRVWEEAQNDVIRPEYWVGFVPYLVVECMHNEYITDQQRRQIEVMLSLHLSKRAKLLARKLVQDIILATLTNSPEELPVALPPETERSRDEVLATWVRRVHFVMPDMDWWAIQNKVWELGTANYPRLTAELGFR